MVTVFCAISYLYIVQNTGTIPVEQKQPYDKYDIAQNTVTIPVERKKPYDKYDIAHNTGTIPVMVPVLCTISYLS
jgi:hypothetical protein